MTHINKILVIGAGIAGTAACYWLKRFGFSPTLIEKFPHIRKGGQPIALHGVVTTLVKKMGIYDSIYNSRTRIERGRYVDAAGNILYEEKGEKFGFRQDDEVEIIHGDLIEILVRLIKDIPCHFNQVIESLKQNEQSVEVHFKNGDQAHYDLVIGADGIYSATRRLVFDPEEYELVNLGAYLSAFTIPNYLNLRHTELWCEVNQKLASIISDKDPKRARASFMCRSQHISNNMRDENEQQQFLRDTFQDFGWEAPKMLELMSYSDDFYFDSMTQVKMKSWSKGRVALVGDSSYSPSPLSGQGNKLALIGAYILAGELKKAGENYRRAFKCYHEILKPLVEANQEFGSWVSESFLVPTTLSPEVAEERSNKILQKMKTISNMISLPAYD